MPSSAALRFTDPDELAQTVRNSNVELTPLGRGPFSGEIIAVNLNRLWMQRFSENLPRIICATNTPGRVIINFRPLPGPPLLTGGIDLLPHTLHRHAEGQTFFQRSEGPSVFCAMSLPIEDVAAIAASLHGVDMSPYRDPASLTPPPAALARLHRLYATAIDLAQDAPQVLASAEAAHAMEQELAHAFIDCLVPRDRTAERAMGAHRATVVKRLGEVLDSRLGEPVHLAELCRALGVSERTLRTYCLEALGEGPMRYLWLRRMNQARRALLRADPATATVTEIATAQGFWELGRFAVQYRSLFGERPSATLARARPA